MTDAQPDLMTELAALADEAAVECEWPHQIAELIVGDFREDETRQRLADAVGTRQGVPIRDGVWLLRDLQFEGRTLSFGGTGSVFKSLLCRHPTNEAISRSARRTTSEASVGSS